MDHVKVATRKSHSLTYIACSFAVPLLLDRHKSATTSIVNFEEDFFAIADLHATHMSAREAFQELPKLHKDALQGHHSTCSAGLVTD